ncbi:MAG: hypothetical protein FWF06_08560, partial [Symbiobacteriaceae bacterium]|nr:hypothetical protein [Symbiobacteriaceae bacterium]
LPLVFLDEVVDTVALMRSIPEGVVAYLGAEVAASNAAELRPIMVAAAKFMFDLGHRIVIGGFWTDGCTLARAWLTPLFDEMGAVYGEDYVILGYRASVTSVLDTARVDFIDAFSDRDIAGQRLSTMPVMAGLERASDLAYCIIMSPGGPGTATYTTAWRATGEVDLIIDCPTGSMYNSAGNTYQSGLTAGLIGGLNGAAQFEQLIHHPGEATRSMDAQSLGHFTIFGFLVVGNIGFFQMRRKEQMEKEADKA